MGRIIIVMGVSGSGKSTIGKLLASELNLPFYDADDFHPESNIDKMRKGVPLDDNDRSPWLHSIIANFEDWQTDGAVLACSALKEKYRDLFKETGSEIEWLVLRGSYDLLLKRMQLRHDHFFFFGPAEITIRQHGMAGLWHASLCR